MLRVFPMSLTGAANRWLRNKPFGLIKTWEDLKIKFLSKYCPPARTAKKIKEINNFQQEPDETLYQAWERFKELLMKCAIPTKTDADAKVAIQEMAEYSQKWHNGTSRTRNTETSNGLAAIQAQLNNLGSEIKKVNEKVYVAQVGCEQCKGTYYTKYFQLKEEEKKGSYGPQFLEAGSYGASHIDNSIPQKEKDLVELADRTVKYSKGIAKNVLVGIGKFVFLVDFIILDIPEDVKVPLILGRSFLSTTHAKIDVFKRKITLRARLIGETMVLNRLLYPLYGAYIELNDLNVPLEVRRNQVNDLMPTIEEGEVVDKQMIVEVRAKDDNKMVSKFFGYPSDYNC
nr:hypothetical protein [Tanacetum cinerariifolium]